MRNPVPSLYEALEPAARGLGLSLVEISLFRHKGTTQIRVVAHKKGGTSLNDCSAFHRAALPRLELAFPGEDLYVEVSSPGIDREFKDGAEFAFFIGEAVRCYRRDISDWSGGILESADAEGITLKGKDGTMSISYETIAKAKLGL
jgi:ribosome maturation factor RimP